MKKLLTMLVLVIASIGLAQHPSTTMEAVLVTLDTSDAGSECEPTTHDAFRLALLDIARNSGVRLVDYVCRSYEGTYDRARVDEIFSLWETSGWSFENEMWYSVYAHLERRDVLAVWVSTEYGVMTIGIFNE